MNTQWERTDSGPSSQSQSAVLEFVVKRDGDRPLSFAGVRLAKATRNLGIPQVHVETLEAAIYRTRGGKFITSLSKSRIDPLAKLIAVASPFNPFESDDEKEGASKSGYDKAAVHDNFESAMAWFKPGRLTDEIRRQLGLDKPERIE